MCLIVNVRTLKTVASGISGYYYSASKTSTGSDKQHHDAFVVYGETGMLVETREADTIHIPRDGSARITWRYRG